MRKLADATDDIFGGITPPVPGTGDADFASKLMTMGIQLFFIIGGIAAMVYMLWGAFDWIISSGDKERLTKAQSKIRNAVIGLILIVVVLTIIVTMERVVFNCKFCFGISCGIRLPTVDTAATPTSCEDLP